MVEYLIMYSYSYLQLYFLPHFVNWWKSSILVNPTLGMLAVTTMISCCILLRLGEKGVGITSTEGGKRFAIRNFGTLPILKAKLIEAAIVWLISIIFYYSFRQLFVWTFFWEQKFGKIGFLAANMIAASIILFFLDWRKYLVGLAETPRPDYAQLFSSQDRLSTVWSGWNRMVTYVSGESSSFKPEIESSGRQQQQYKYKELGQGQIRLLQLRRWHPEGKVSCNLVHVSIDQHPPYEAISYYWGTAPKDCIIIIDGESFAVTPTVFKILEGHSSVRHSKLLWIDSICINQEDDVEKGTQVQLMRRIYRQAKRVMVCLGDFQWMLRPEVWLAVLFVLRVFVPRGPFLRIFGPVFRVVGAWAAFREIMEAPYWSRVWVVQEVAVASKIRILVGSVNLPWEYLLCLFDTMGNGDALTVEFAKHFFSGPDETADRFWPDKSRLAITNGMVMAHFQHLVRTQEKLPLKRVIRKCWGFKAAFPNDRVYALLGLATGADLSNDLLKVDYSSSNPVRTVFRNAAQYMYSREDASILLNDSGCGFERNINDLPSWVPDWSKSRECRWYGDGDTVKASGDIPASISLGPDMDALCVQGVQVDKIKKVGFKHGLNGLELFHPSASGSDPRLAQWFNSMMPKYTSDPHYRFQTLLNWFREAEEMALQMVPDPYPTGASRVEALWRTVTAKENTISGDIEFDPDIFKDSLEGLEFLHLNATSPNSIPYAKFGTSADPASIERFRTKIRRSTLNLNLHFTDTRFCVTERGYIGMAPGGARVGDLVVIVFAVSSPCFLRWCTGCSNIKGLHPCYHHIGVGYVHGMMQGEMVRDVGDPKLFTLY